MAKSLNSKLLILFVVVVIICVMLKYPTFQYLQYFPNYWINTDSNFTSLNQNYNYNPVNMDSDPINISISDLVVKASLQIPNIPPLPNILSRNISEQRSNPTKNLRCKFVRFPTIYDMEFRETVWQIQTLTSGTIYLYGAYWDVRVFKNHEDPSVRVLTFIDRVLEDIGPLFCQVWFENTTQPLIVEANYFHLWHNLTNGELHPYFINCNMAKNYNGALPTSVSIVASRCANATNNVRIHFEKPKKKESFAVCVKGLFFTMDYSTQLVQWIEMLKIMGVKKIILYNLGVHPNVEKVFKYYENTKLLEVLPLSHPKGIPNEPHLRQIYFKIEDGTLLQRKWVQERIPANDCFYRNMYKYDYIAYHDTDEIILPRNNATNWSELMDGLEKNHNKQDPYYDFKDLRFQLFNLPDVSKEINYIPEYMHMLRRTTRYRGRYGKIIYRPLDILVIGQHMPESCIHNCTPIYVKVTKAASHHYRLEPDVLQDNISYSTDYQMWKWKDQLILNCNKTLVDLKFILN